MAFPTPSSPIATKIFTSAMWRSLLSTIGTKLAYSTTYHPQMDGQTERVNQCLEIYLRCTVHNHPKMWKLWLQVEEFRYNTSHHSSLHRSPYQTMYGREPYLGRLPAWETSDSIDTDLN